MISVAKQRSRHSVPQEGSTRYLVREALAGRTVVRLKGGDPFIFGRGGEEVEACRAAGVRSRLSPAFRPHRRRLQKPLLPLTHRDASALSVSLRASARG
jgi:uroporphyrin-III C-methyltransferase